MELIKSIPMNIRFMFVKKILIVHQVWFVNFVFSLNIFITLFSSRYPPLPYSVGWNNQQLSPAMSPILAFDPTIPRFSSSDIVQHYYSGWNCVKYSLSVAANIYYHQKISYISSHRCSHRGSFGMKTVWRNHRVCLHTITGGRSWPVSRLASFFTRNHWQKIIIELYS